METPIATDRESSCTLCDDRVQAARPSTPSPVCPDECNGPTIHGLTGEWQTGRFLGSGAFSSVRLARGPRGVAVAKTTPSGSPRNLFFALREARVLAHLPPHRSVPPLLDVAKTSDAVHAIFGRAPGEELFAYVNSHPGGKLPEAEARVIVAELLEALRHAHAHGVLHRDVKMDNVLYDPSTHTLSLIDFGLATFFDSLTLLDEPVGCIHYASPGLLRLVCRGSPYPARRGHQDLWAAGVLAHGLLTGFFPFRHEEPLDLQAEVARGPPQPVDGASDGANAFLALVLDARNEGKISASSLLEHPWLADVAPERAPVRSVGKLPKLPSSAFDPRRAAEAARTELALALPGYLASLDAADSGDESDGTVGEWEAGPASGKVPISESVVELQAADKPRRARRFDPGRWFARARRLRVAAA
ncbi:kinase-like domain-containing protein [Hyaloraphidium curvatum]|nr:kinase-like domain-containing protein [Hyaloraphidium curvatum]